MSIKTPAEADGSTNAWLADGEKYALIGLSQKLDGTPPGQLTLHLWALTGAAFSIPAHWREWLGTRSTSGASLQSSPPLSGSREVDPGWLRGPY